MLVDGLCVLCSRKDMVVLNIIRCRQTAKKSRLLLVLLCFFVCFEGGERYFVSVVSVFFFFFLSFHSFLHPPLKEVEVHGPWALQEDFFNV